MKRNSLSVKERLKLRLCDPPAQLIKLDLFPRNEALLQRAPDPDGVDGALQLHRRRQVLEAALGELVGLGDKGLPKPVVVRRRHLEPHTRRVVHVDPVERWLHVDPDGALRADDLRHVLLACGHHARAEELGNLAALPDEKKPSV